MGDFPARPDQAVTHERSRTVPMTNGAAHVLLYYCSNSIQFFSIIFQLHQINSSFTLTNISCRHRIRTCKATPDMKIGMLTDSLGNLDLAAMLKAAAELGIECLEFACGNWSSAPHIELDRLLESGDARREFLARLADHALTISALNCSGNPLFPGAEGARQHEITLKTFRLARALGVERVVMMSGLPGGPGDSWPNWIVTEWPPECRTILQYQWDERIIPYWRELTVVAKDCGVRKICLELHGHQAVYNPHTLTRLRNAVGEIVGANYDPSHPLWMGADPLAAVRALGDAVYYVHAKDTDRAGSGGHRRRPRHPSPGKRSRFTQLELRHARIGMARNGGGSSVPS
jgi:sugar phosphate isomerase/epimerase